MKLIRKIKNHLYKVFSGRRQPFKIKPRNNFFVGKMSYHNGNFNVSGDQKVTIGSYCALGKNISIITSNHDYNYTCIQGTFYKHFFHSEHPGVNQIPPNRERTKGSVWIGNDVWISHNVTILSGVKIGNGACIANNSVVTKDVDPFSIVAGIPAHEIKKRYDYDKIQFLEEIKWWNWNDNKIIKNKEFFFLDINKTSLNDLKKIIK